MANAPTPALSRLDHWLDHLDALLPASPEVAALREALAVEGPQDPGFARLTAAIAASLDAHRRLGSASPSHPGTDGAERRLVQAFNAGLANAVHQIESFLGIQHYLGSGKSLPAFHGWCISPDMGKWLVDRIGVQVYDLVIEFGSGTSTLLMAQAMAARRRATGLPLRRRALPRRIVSFEHDPVYLASTRALLAANAVDRRVALIHAPLVDRHEGDQPQPFYDCEHHLRRLALALGSDGARILVLVDGPPGHTGPLARYPAVPRVFDVLGQHHIDWVLDDAHRPDERAVIERWRAFWAACPVEVEEHRVVCEKGMYAATSTPNPTLRGLLP